MDYPADLSRIKAKFGAKSRYANFGPIIRQMEVRGFRGVADLTLDLASPIVALCGLNGTGKSTIAQLAACAYKKPITTALKRYYVKDFFPVSAADPHPFAENARVIYTYWAETAGVAPDTDDPKRQVTVARAAKEWSGYKRQPERSCYYVGFTQFIPKIERRDFSIYGGHLAQLGESRLLDVETAQRISLILGIPYEEMGLTSLVHKNKVAELALACRAGQRYSENNMGFGEGRVFYLVNQMESAPAQSLFVLEEPETSLHGQAQAQLARYLINVSARRGHQIVLTTHSSAVLGELPKDSLLYLRRTPGDASLQAIPGLAVYQIDSYLRGVNSDRAPLICVEDEFAAAFVKEVLRVYRPHLLAACRTVPIGSKDQFHRTIRLLTEVGVKAVGLTDGDAGHAGDGNVMSLPGGKPPECVILLDESVEKYLLEEYDVAVDEVIVGMTDPHDFCPAIAAKVLLDPGVVAANACHVFVKHRPKNEFTKVIEFLSQRLG